MVMSNMSKSGSKFITQSLGCYSQAEGFGEKISALRGDPDCYKNKDTFCLQITIL